jgi:hypothetical protein
VHGLVPGTPVTLDPGVSARIQEFSGLPPCCFMTVLATGGLHSLTFFTRHAPL